MKLVYDIETNGLLDTLTKIHCICLGDVDSGEIFEFSTLDGNIENGIRFLEKASQVIGFNNLDFDQRAIEKLYRNTELHKRIKWKENLDMHLFARLKFPDTTAQDFGKTHSGFPIRLINVHSLEAWGYRIGALKGTYGKTTDWQECTREMIDYCKQDVRVTMALYKTLKPDEYSSDAIQLEHDVKRYIIKQEQNGVPFNTTKARELYKQIKTEYDQKWESVKTMFPPKKTERTFTPKVNSTKFGYKKGEQITKVTEVPFNPGSREQLIEYFKTKYNWEPIKFTDKNNPEMGADVLSELPYDEAKVISLLFDMKKAMGTIFDGKNGWIKMVKDGKIHGRVITNGCISGRASHKSPNLGNVPNVNAYMGKECRELFSVEDPWRFVGGDAAAIQVRILAHYLHYWDGGEYAHTAVNGDIHSKNREAFGLGPTKENRDIAKTIFFAMIFGAGKEKIGRTVDPHASLQKAEAIGNEILMNFRKNVPAYARLLDLVKQKYYNQGYILGLDGRRLLPRSAHSGLCALIQGGEAVVMKKALTIFDRKLLELGINVFPALWVHDEWEVVAHKDDAEKVADMIPQSIIESGEHFNLKCPMNGSKKIGMNWFDVH